MIQRHIAVLVGLTAVVLVLTGAAVRGSGSTAFMGVVAPVIVPAILTWSLIMVLAYSRTITEILAAVLLARPKEEGGHRRSLLATIVSWLIVFGLVILLTRSPFLERFSSVLQQTAGFFMTRLGVAPPTASPIASPSAMTSLLFYYTLVIFATITMVSFSLLFASFYKAYRYARTTFVDTDAALRNEMLDVVQETRADLEGSVRYHEVILNCYRQMCKILSDRGFSITPTQTAREFGTRVSRKLELGGESVNGLTFLFEEARYSDHLIKDQKRQLAVNYLSSLERILIDVGAKD